MSTSQPTDVAAMATGVVAVSVSILLTQGPYDLSGVVVGATSLIIIVSFIGSHKRNSLQSASFAMLMALITIPIFGYFLEIYKDGRCTALNRLFNAISEAGIADLSTTSCVKHREIAIAWLALSVVFFTFDKIRQRNLTTKEF